MQHHLTAQLTTLQCTTNLTYPGVTSCVAGLELASKKLKELERRKTLDLLDLLGMKIPGKERLSPKRAPLDSEPGQWDIDCLSATLSMDDRSMVLEYERYTTNVGCNR